MSGLFKCYKSYLNGIIHSVACMTLSFRLNKGSIVFKETYYPRVWGALFESEPYPIQTYIMFDWTKVLMSLSHDMHLIDICHVVYTVTTKALVLRQVFMASLSLSSLGFLTKETSIIAFIA
jgi:hypothetical protein